MEWYPKRPLRYAAKTMHLTLAEHGAYNLLIDWYMVHEQPIPDDNAAISKILGCEMDEWIRISARIVPFFVRADGQLRHLRCEEELSAQTEQKKKWQKWQRDSRARKALKHKETCNPDSQEMSSDSTVQDKTVQNTKKEAAEEVLQRATQTLTQRPAAGTRPDYDDPKVRKARWQQKIINELHNRFTTARAEAIVDAYGRGEKWAKDEFEAMDQYIKQRKAVAGGMER